MNDYDYCGVCGVYARYGNGFKVSRHECSPRSLSAINATETRSTVDGIFDCLNEPSLDDQLRDGFAMLADDEQVTWSESRERQALDSD